MKKLGLIFLAILLIVLVAPRQGTADEGLPGELTLPSDRVVNEGDGMIHVLISRIGGSFGEIPIHFETRETGSAQARWDYVPLDNIDVFANGELEKTLSIRLLEDVYFEGEESFNVTISCPTNGEPFCPPLKITIQDNEIVGTPGKLTMENSLVVSETTGLVEITVTRINGSDGLVTANYSTVFVDSAAEGLDYGNSFGKLTFKDGETEKTFTIPILKDGILEENEYFDVALHSPTGNVILGDPLTITILNVLYAPGKLIMNTSELVEELDGLMEVHIQRIEGTDGTVSSVITAESLGSAEEGSDFEPFSKTLTFEEGETDKYAYLRILEDAEIEGEEYFDVTLSQPTGGVTLEGPARIRINDNDFPVDPPVGVLSFSINPETTSAMEIWVSENDSVVRLPVYRHEGSFGSLKANYLTIVASADETDFQAVSDTIEFSANETGPQYLTIQLKNDEVPEAQEEFSVLLLPAGEPSSMIRSSLYRIFLTSDDMPEANIHIQSPYVNVRQPLLLTADVPGWGTMDVFWQITSGAGLAHFEDPRSLETLITIQDPGEYEIKLMGNIGFGWQDLDTTKLICRPPAAMAEQQRKSINLANVAEGGEVRIDTAANTGDHLRITIFDRSGQEIIQLYDGNGTGGVQHMSWNGRDSSGNMVAAGVYHALIKEGSSHRSLKLVIIN